MAEKERQQRSEAKVLGVPRTLSYTDRNAMLHAYEKSYGHLEDREQPSSDYVALKVEEIEQGELLASALDEVGSKDEALTLSVQSSVDAAGRLRVTRERKKSKLPKDSEELRAKLRLEATAMTMLGAKFQTRAWFVRRTVKEQRRCVQELRNQGDSLPVSYSSSKAWGGYKGKGKQKGLAKGKTLSGRCASRRTTAEMIALRSAGDFPSKGPYRSLSTKWTSSGSHRAGTCS
eukprot:s1678_g16.t1